MPKKIKLTRRKREWVDQFKPTAVLRGSTVHQNIATENKYKKDLAKLIDEVIVLAEKEVNTVFKSEASKEYFAQDASIASVSRIALNNLKRKIAALLKLRGPQIAQRMIKSTDKNSASATHNSLKDLSGGLSIKTSSTTGPVDDVLKASITANVDMITTVADDYIGRINQAVNRVIQGGGSVETLTSEIQTALKSEARTTKNRAKNIAIDQTRKAYNSLNAARFKKAGITKFEWVHTGGAKEPRRMHKANFPSGLNGGIFELNNPPVIDDKGTKGLPGYLPFCGCTMRPVIEFTDGAEDE